MKTTKVLLLGAVVAAFSFTAFAGTGAYLLKASAASNIQAAADTTVTTIAYVNFTTPISPRTQANQSKVIQGASNDQTSALACRKNMVASPKAVAECASHATMPGCVSIAALK